MEFCVFGDSIAKGVVYDSIKQKYLIAKECCANLFESATGFAVQNYARFGATIHKGREIASKHLQELQGYNSIVLEFGGNDCDFHWDAVAADPDGSHEPNVPLAEFEDAYRGMIDDVQQNGGHPVLMTIPPLNAARFFQWISKGLNAENILHWLGGDANTIYRWQEMYNLAICRLAVEKDVPLVDIRNAFLGKRNYSDYLCEDGMHPNERGHALINEALCASWNKVSPIQHM